MINDYVKRYSTLALAIAVLTTVIFQPDLWNTILISTVAVVQSVVLADAVQWLYTTVKFTSNTHKLEHTRATVVETDTIVAAKLRALGMIYLGVSVLVGLSYYAVYFVQRVPGSGQ